MALGVDANFPCDFHRLEREADEHLTPGDSAMSWKGAPHRRCKHPWVQEGKSTQSFKGCLCAGYSACRSSDRGRSSSGVSFRGPGFCSHHPPDSRDSASSALCQGPGPTIIKATLDRASIPSHCWDEAEFQC